uniref:AlNc14C150G7496 protein n=1 Tax=Albugo laibachii Nc14 TaxID=890382 RepID=F0WLY3_9STRA|nr:AlNc14C150G7496 [Albugo laibachii Nc14]|eukprot:CCA22310.1 AlNc14C150G7496 [Albugo laibachii Nc14]
MLAKDVTVQWNFISPCSCASSESTQFVSDSPIHINQENMESLHTYTLSPQYASPSAEWNDTKTIESGVRSLTEIDTVTEGYTTPCTEYMVRNDTIAASNCEDITTTTLTSLSTTYFSNNSCIQMKENELIEVENGSNRTNSHTKSDTSSIEENLEGDFSSDDEDYNGESNRWSKASSLPSRFSVKSMHDTIRTSVADLNRFRVQSQSRNWKPRSVPFGSAFLSRDLPISSIKDMRQKATQCASKAADYIHSASSQATTTLKRHATLPKLYKESFSNLKRRSTDETQTVVCPEDIEIDHAEV